LNKLCSFVLSIRQKKNPEKMHHDIQKNKQRQNSTVVFKMEKQ